MAGFCPEGSEPPWPPVGVAVGGALGVPVGVLVGVPLAVAVGVPVAELDGCGCLGCRCSALRVGWPGLSVRDGPADDHGRAVALHGAAVRRRGELRERVGRLGLVGRDAAAGGQGADRGEGAGTEQAASDPPPRTGLRARCISSLLSLLSHMRDYGRDLTVTWQCSKNRFRKQRSPRCRPGCGRDRQHGRPRPVSPTSHRFSCRRTAEVEPGSVIYDAFDLESDGVAVVLRS